MSRWLDTYQKPPFNRVWGEIKEKIASIPKDHVIDQNIALEWIRFQKVVVFIDQMLSGLDPDFVPLKMLDTLGRYFNEISTNLNYFENQGQLNNIKEANNSLDDALSIMRQIVPIPRGKELKSLTAAANKYASALNEYLTEFHNNANNVLEEIKSSSQTVRNDLDQLTKSTDQMQETLTKTQDDIDSKINDMSEEFNKKADETLGELNKHQETAEKVLGVILDTTHAGSYNAQSNKESKTADLLRGGSVFLMLIGVLTLTYAFYLSFSREIVSTSPWTDTLLRTSLVLACFGTAIYLAKESAKHRGLANINKRRELTMVSIGPYLNLLENAEDKEEIKKEVARRLFIDES